MKKLLAVLAGAALFAAPASASLRLYFSTLGPATVIDQAQSDAMPATGVPAPPVTNPAVDTSGGPTTLYLYGRLTRENPNGATSDPSTQYWTGVGINLRIDGGTGTFVGGVDWALTEVYDDLTDPSTVTYRRWNGVNSGTNNGNRIDLANAAGVSGQGINGIQNNTVARLNDYNSDIYNAASNALPHTFLIGTIQVQGTGSLFLEVSTGRITRSGASQTAPSWVAFGADDPFIQTDTPSIGGVPAGTASPTADATLVPEPASLLLLGLAGLALRRR